MKTILACLGVGVLWISSVVQGQDLFPIPDVQISGAPIHESTVVEGNFVEAPLAVPLYTNVKYKDRDEMSPCAQPKIIAVKNPCACRHACHCGAPECVYIEICVPTCGCELVSCRRNGDRIRYDYGKYAVDVRIKKGYIEVDYQD